MCRRFNSGPTHSIPTNARFVTPCLRTTWEHSCVGSPYVSLLSAFPAWSHLHWFTTGRFAAICWAMISFGLSIEFVLRGCRFPAQTAVLDQLQVGLIGDTEKHDRQIAGDTIAPQAGLPTSVACDEGAQCTITRDGVKNRPRQTSVELYVVFIAICLRGFFRWYKV